MTIKTKAARFKGCRGMGTPCDYQVPILEAGDKVELSGWGVPIIGTVLEVTEGGLGFFELPIAVPGGGDCYACTIARVRKVWRGEDFLDLEGIGLESQLELKPI